MTDEKLIEVAFKAHEDIPTWDDDPVGRDSAIRWHMRGFNDGLAAFEKAHVPTDVAEEPEWEYSWAGTDDEDDDWVMDDAFDTRESAEAYTRRPIGGWVRTDHGELVRRRKAGPWLPASPLEGQGDERV